MAGSGNAARQPGISAEAAMTGILALLIEEREERKKGDRDAEKIEVILAKAGLSNDDIAAVTGKQSGAVRMAISRTKKAKPKKRAK
jgi:DNA-directed RNA polymerase specialized sigma24 family protein